VHRLVEPVGEALELAVHLDAQGLERAPGRVGPPAAGRRGDRRGDRLDQLAGGGDGPGRHDAARDLAGEALLAVGGDDARQRILVVLVDHLGGGQLLAGVHPHVERCVGQVREPARRPVQLRAADPQIEEHSHDVPLAFSRHDRGDLVEPTPDHPSPVSVLRQTLPGRRHGIPVPVDAQEPEVGSGGQQPSGVPTASHGGVHHQAGRHSRQQLAHLPGHHRLVGELHSCS
jgi:hypothetical protein